VRATLVVVRGWYHNCDRALRYKREERRTTRITARKWSQKLTSQKRCCIPKGICRCHMHLSRTKRNITRRPASADRTARRQFQATGQPMSRTQASDAVTSRLPRDEAKCVQRRCFQCGPVPLRSDIKVIELPPANILIPLERQLIELQRAADILI